VWCLCVCVSGSGSGSGECRTAIAVFDGNRAATVGTVTMRIACSLDAQTVSCVGTFETKASVILRVMFCVFCLMCDCKLPEDGLI